MSGLCLDMRLSVLIASALRDTKLVEIKGTGGEAPRTTTQKHAPAELEK